jgi:hypothetical protein
MTIFGIVCVALGVVSCIAFASLCVRPALRVRSLAAPSAGRDLTSVAAGASGSLASIRATSVEFELAKQRLGVAAGSMDAAFASIAAYSRQVAIVSVVVDSALEFVVPRLRGML